MRLFEMLKKVLPLAICLLGMLVTAAAQQPTDKQTPPDKPVEGPATVAPAGSESDSVLVTIILKHQQNKNLPEIRRILEAQGFWDIFPPQDARVVSWTIAMNLGHVILLQIPAGAERRLNLALENGAWGAFDTEIYLTYDYKPIWEDYIGRRAEAKDDRN
jgi:hypothetical protein